MMEITTEIMAEVLIIIGMATKEVKRGLMSELIFALFYVCCRVLGLEKYLKKLIGNTDIEDSLEKLDKLTQEEARMASAEQLRIAHSVEGKVMSVDERVQGVGDEVQDVGRMVEDVNDNVRGINEKMQDVNDKVQGIDDGVKDVEHKVQDVDRKLDDTNRSSSPLAHPLLPNAQTYSQGIYSATIFCDGSHLLMHPQTITSHPKLITTVPLDGSFKAAFSKNGSPLVRFCGYTENVCFS